MTPASTSALKKLSALGLAAMAVLAIGGVVFYKERLLFADSSFIAFNILNLGKLYVQEHRYGSFITQMVLLAGCKLHLPISVVLKGYTFSFNFFYLLVAAVVYRCRQYALVIIMSLYYVLLVSDTYFWTNNEIHQAIAWMFLFYGVVLRMAADKVRWPLLLPVFVLLAFLALYTHFIVILPFGFLWVFLWLRNEDWPFSKKESWWLSVLLLLIVASKFLLLKSNSYDDAHLNNITHLCLRDLYLCYVSDGVKVFLYRVLTNYWVVLGIVPAGLIAARKANKQVAIWSAMAIVGYISIMGITYPMGDILQFHIESEWQSLAVIMSAAFVYYALPAMNLRVAAVALVCIFLARFFYIGRSEKIFSWRVRYTQNVLDAMKNKGINKLVLANDSTLHAQYMLDFTLPEESTLLSAMDGDVPQRTFLFADTYSIANRADLANPKMVRASWSGMKPADWNYEYFKPDTTHPYVITTIKDLFTRQ